LNVGIFVGPGKSREQCGAAYYGVMEMSTNLSEICISIGMDLLMKLTGRLAME